MLQKDMHKSIPGHGRKAPASLSGVVDKMRYIPYPDSLTRPQITRTISLSKEEDIVKFLKKNVKGMKMSLKSIP